MSELPSTAPAADFFRFLFLSDSAAEDERSKHEGRVRTFSHFPGNWAMHVFIPCECYLSYIIFTSTLIGFSFHVCCIISRQGYRTGIKIGNQ